MADGDKFFEQRVLKRAFFPLVKASLICLLLAGCVNTPTVGIPGLEADNLLPDAVILSPPEAAEMNMQIDSANMSSSNLFSVGSEVFFSGIGIDPEDDSLSAGSLQWRSDKDGELGAGTALVKSDLSPGTHWIFLTATDSQGATASDSVHITVGEKTETLPLAPSGLVALVKSATGITLGWEDHSDNEAHFVIEQRLAGANTGFAISATVAKNTTSAEITGLKPGNLYEFRVYAENVSGASEPSNIAQAKTFTEEVVVEEVVDETLELLAPSNLKALVQSSTGMLLSWTDNSVNETHFIVEQRVAGSGAYFVQGAITAANDTSVSITGLKADTPYEFRVYAYEETSTSASAYSNVDTEKTLIAELLSYVTADNILDSGSKTLVNETGQLSVGSMLLGLLSAEYRAALEFAGVQEAVKGREIGSASLSFYPKSDVELAESAAFAVNAFEFGWSPKEITWENQPSYYQEIQSEQMIVSLLSSIDPLKFDVTPIVQKWANGEWQNNGFIFRGVPDLITIVADFESMDTALNDRARQPQLHIKFND